ncbi:XRE family transcriptional regulator, partial [Vibrio cholerae]|nr:XRE family transcriptional regulator [Vibrio cholerae]
KIKAIRKSKKLTQPAFGLMINNGQLIDKKTIYEWEKGTYLPIPERLSRIADLGNMSIEELVCGNVEEYILGIILYRDSIVLDGITFPDKNLFQHLRQQFPPVHSNLDTWLDRYSKLEPEMQEFIANKTCNKVKNEKISLFNILKIEELFINAIVEEFDNNILFLTSSIEELLERMVDEWLPIQLKDMSYPEEAVREITDNINKLEQTISSIGKKYTKKKMKGGDTI